MPDALDRAADRIRYDYQSRTLPYPELVDGGAMLDEITAVINRFNAALPEGANTAISLWVAMTYCLYSCGMQIAPRLMVRKPVSNAGGTNLLTVLMYLVRRPKYNSGITEANYLSQANKRRTVIVDECDGVLKGNTKLIKMMIAGHGYQGVEIQIIKNVPVEFEVFCPLITCGIGDYAPPTHHNRSFLIAVKRMMTGEEAESFDDDLHAPMMRTLREMMIRWVEDHVDAIRECRPELDRGLVMKRQRENIATLLKIADVAGGEWPRRAREALTALTARDKPMDETELLIGDIAEILLDPDVILGDPPQRIGADGFVFSGDLHTILRERFPHRALYETGFTQAKLASMLGTFDIETGQQRGASKYCVPTGAVTSMTRLPGMRPMWSRPTSKPLRSLLHRNRKFPSRAVWHSSRPIQWRLRHQSRRRVLHCYRGEMEIAYPNTDVAEPAHKNRLGA